MSEGLERGVKTILERKLDSRVAEGAGWSGLEREFVYLLVCPVCLRIDTMAGFYMT